MEQMRNPENERTIAGYRVVRRIGTGSRSTVYLGRAGDGRGGSLTVAVKVFRRDADPAALDRQVRAMLVLPPAMLAPLRDLATAADGRLCLVMDRLAGSPLDRVLAERGRIGAGEVVTIAATITAALQALHDAGFSHPMIGPDCVRFDGGGRPVLLGLGALEDLPAGGAGVSRRRDDLVRLAGWTRSLLEHLDPHAPEAAAAGSVLAEYEAAATARPLPADLLAVESALFAWATATAVRGAVPGEPDEGTPAGALIRSGASPSTLTRPARPAGAAAESAVPAGRERLSGAGLWSPVARVLGQVVGQVAQLRETGRTSTLPGLALLRSRLARAFDGNRRVGGRPVVVGVCLAVLLSAGGVALLSVAGSPAASGESTGRPAAAAAADESSATQDGAPAGSADVSAPLVGDDPAEAALALLQLREGCLAAASVLCLEGVDQAGSVAMAADSYTVRQAAGTANGATRPPEGRGAREAGLTATIQERRGNAALIVLTPAGGGPQTQPASTLVIKGEAGWRLRELFDY